MKVKYQENEIKYWMEGVLGRSINQVRIFQSLNNRNKSNLLLILQNNLISNENEDRIISK